MKSNIYIFAFIDSNYSDIILVFKKPNSFFFLFNGVVPQPRFKVPYWVCYCHKSSFYFTLDINLRKANLPSTCCHTFSFRNDFLFPIFEFQESHKDKNTDHYTKMLQITHPQTLLASLVLTEQRIEIKICEKASSVTTVYYCKNDFASVCSNLEAALSLKVLC